MEHSALNIIGIVLTSLLVGTLLGCGSEQGQVESDTPPVKDAAVVAKESTVDESTDVAVDALADTDGPLDLVDAPVESIEAANPADQAVDVSAISEIVEQREKLNATIWSDEVMAQKFEEPFIELWDRMRGSADQVGELARFEFEDLTIGLPGEPTSHDHSIDEFRCDNGTKSFTPEEWQSWLADWKDAGLQVVQGEFHHSRFEPDDKQPRSTVSFVLDVANTSEQTYYNITGKLRVNWKPLASESDQPQAKSIEATDVTILRREASPIFEEATVLDVRLANRAPLIAHDLDGDGLSELLAPAENILFQNQGNFQFEPTELFKYPPGKLSSTGVLADFTADGRPDFLGSSVAGTVFLYTADESGDFSNKPTIVLTTEDIREPTVVTAGDIDADGDLDVWIGQYKSPYSGGQMPTPYYDANDGYPAYLIRNNGDGTFEDITEWSGLTEKRNRRTYSASLADIDDDRDLDLVVVSDFAGLDVYANDGTGKFTNVTDEKVDNRHAFGMSLSFSDYNMDSKLDFYMTGMASTTAKRLHAMGLGQEDFEEYQSARPAMGYGNRLYLADGNNFNQAPFNDQIARTGWSWGSTSFDFDNDGDRDLFVANGHRSQRTAKDYCTDFWCHDIYTGSSEEDQELGEFFKLSSALNFRKKGISWNGFEHNKLLMNKNGEGFLSIGFLAGVASEFDSRNVISDDFDGDGRVDLVVLYRTPVDRVPSLHVLKNQCETEANWIGVRLDGASRPGLGARVTVKTPSQTHIAAIVSGDSYVSQHAPFAHFGLGSASEVEEIEITWPDGASVMMTNPDINQYHQIQAENVVASKSDTAE